MRETRVAVDPRSDAQKEVYTTCMTLLLFYVGDPVVARRHGPSTHMFQREGLPTYCTKLMIHFADTRVEFGGNLLRRIGALFTVLLFES